MFENSKTDQQNKEHKRIDATKNAETESGIKSFTPLPSGIDPVPVQSKKNSIQKMQETAEKPAYFQPNAIQKMQMKTEEEEQPMQMMKDEEEEPAQMKKDSSNAMPESVQSKMENSFGTDFSNVNIHANDNSATEMGALAYTQGNDIHFAPGQYNPQSTAGQELLGHELTHVIQQSQGRVQSTTQQKGMGVNDDPSLEKEADEMGKKAAQGQKLGNNFSATNSNAAQCKVAQLYSSIPSSAIILEVDTSPSTILEKLQAAASYSCGTSKNVNWRSRLFADIEGEVRNLTLRSIPFNFIETNGINTTWEGSISFEIDNITPTGKTAEQDISRNFGGTQTNETGNSTTIGSSSSTSIGIEKEKGGATGSAGIELGTSHEKSSEQKHGVSGSGGGSTSSKETLKRYKANLVVYIDISGAPDYSSWYDYVNIAKWGGSMAVEPYSGRFNVGKLFYDKPDIK